MTLLTVFSATLIADFDLTRLDAVVLLLIFGGLMAWTIYQGLKKNDDSLANEIEAETAEKEMPPKRAVFWLVAGLVMLMLSRAESVSRNSTNHSRTVRTVRFKSIE